MLYEVCCLSNNKDYVATEDPLFIKLRPTNRELFCFQGNLIVVLIVVTTIVTESNGALQNYKPVTV
jgi:hypothetical protein